MEIVTLPSGIEIPKHLVAGTILSLESLLRENGIAFYDLVMMCRDSNYEAFGNNGDVLKKTGFMEGNGRPHRSIQNIVNAIVKGKGLDMHIVPLDTE